MKDRPFDLAARARVVRERLTADDPTEDIVAAAEDVVLSKLEWYRAGGEVSERQWGDVIGVLMVQGDQLDDRYLRRWAAELKVLDLLQRAQAERAELEG